MTAMLVQVPLPWLPGDAEEIAPGVGVVASDGGGVVWVPGWPPSPGTPGMRRPGAWRRCSW